MPPPSPLSASGPSLRLLWQRLCRAPWLSILILLLIMVVRETRDVDAEAGSGGSGQFFVEAEAL